MAAGPSYFDSRGINFKRSSLIPVSVDDIFFPALTCTVEAVSSKSSVTSTNETSDGVSTSSVSTATAVVSQTLIDI